MLAVLPGTGGLTRVIDKRKVRRDRADMFCTDRRGRQGPPRPRMGLVDEIVAASRLEAAVAERASAFAERPVPGRSEAAGSAGVPREDHSGIALTPLQCRVETDRRDYEYVHVRFDRGRRLATVTLRGPDRPPGSDGGAMVAEGASFWPLQLARELDDAILDIRFNEAEVAAILFESEGDPRAVLAYDLFLDDQADHWLAHEIRLKWRRVLKRIDLTARSLVVLIEPDSCFAGALAEIVFAADRSWMLIGTRDSNNRSPAALMLGKVNLSGMLAMANGLCRLQTRFLGDHGAVDAATAMVGETLDAETAERARVGDARA